MGTVVIAMTGVGCALAGYHGRRWVGQRKIQEAEAQAKQILESAALRAETTRREAELEGKELLHRIRQEFEQQTQETRRRVGELERRLGQKEGQLDRKVEQLDLRERGLAERERSLTAKAQQLDQMLLEEKSRLQEVAGLVPEQAKALLLTKMESDVRQEASLMIKRIEDEAKQEADRRARNIIGLAIQRCAPDHTIESTVSVINLPSEEMKGRIIGREGRNIRAFETATGVDLIVDDTPESVTLSAFDMVRREIARIALTRLMSDGRIHPARIEEVVDKVKKEMEQTIQQEGEQAIQEVGLQQVHPEMVKLLGRLRYRTSYSQNVLAHLKECAFIMNVLASELGIPPALARRAALFHDIGKAVSHEIEGPHALIGADLARKYGESADVIHAIEAHHNEVPPHNLIAVLTQVSDAISGSRPGARGDTLENYVRRLKALESIADSFKGVAKSYAIQAGREVRVIVQPERVTDLEAIALAREIRQRIEGGLEFPGQIKVTVVRETRAVEYAR
ncbi:MAG: ribonuclease Y [Candidatus Omnitrophica bacterium]|nr:ribonuclease Y [Candidatus Omnitrophota bacterium]